MASYLDIHPLDGVIEIGGIWFAPELNEHAQLPRRFSYCFHTPWTI